jgi:hypothetical protein
MLARPVLKPERPRGPALDKEEEMRRARLAFEVHAACFGFSPAAIRPR